MIERVLAELMARDVLAGANKVCFDLLAEHDSARINKRTGYERDPNPVRVIQG